ncbi:MAG: hypothetical protein ACI846_000114 [Pseudoalteromonas distincta]|jgi:hypothetical protein
MGYETLKINTNQKYVAASKWYSIQVDVPEGQTAVLKLKVPGATNPISKEFIESGIYSDFIGHCEVEVENEECEFAISPEIEAI